MFLAGLFIAGIAVIGPVLTSVLVVAATAVVLILWRPQLSVYATFILAFATLPAFVPTTIAIGPITLRLAEVTLIAAAVWCTARLRAPRSTNVALGAFLALIAVWAIGGYAAGNLPANILTDVRPITTTLLAAYVAARVAGTPVVGQIAKMLPWLLWTAVPLILLSSIAGLQLTGRSESASLTDTSAADEATRILTPTNFLALVILCGCITLALTGRRRMKESWVYWVPSLIILALAFSRNSLIGVAAAVAFAFLARWSFRVFIRVLGLAAGIALAAILIVAANPVLADVPGGAWVNEQVSSYQTRVLDGLDSNVQATDPSTQFREQSENAFAVPKIEEAPIVGYGFGYAYKAPIGLPGTFFYDSAPLYVHNFYLWLTLKTGLLGMAIFAAISVWALIRGARIRDSPSIALGGGLAALLACSIVAPMANGWPTSILIGGVIGALLPRGVARFRRSSAKRLRTTSANSAPAQQFSEELAR